MSANISCQDLFNVVVKKLLPLFKAWSKDFEIDPCKDLSLWLEPRELLYDPRPGTPFSSDYAPTDPAIFRLFHKVTEKKPHPTFAIPKRKPHVYLLMTYTTYIEAELWIEEREMQDQRSRNATKLKVHRFHLFLS